MLSKFEKESSTHPKGESLKTRKRTQSLVKLKLQNKNNQRGSLYDQYK